MTLEQRRQATTGLLIQHQNLVRDLNEIRLTYYRRVGFLLGSNNRLFEDTLSAIATLAPTTAPLTTEARLNDLRDTFEQYTGCCGI